MLQPDFGTAIVMFSSIIMMCFISKNKFKNYLFLLSFAIIAFIILIIISPYRSDRIQSFINPFSDPLGSGFQTIQSLYAIAPGGLIGKGIDASYQKYFYLPEPQTDFIFAVAGEEMGFIGAVVIVLLLLFITYQCFRTAKAAKDLSGKLICTGMGSLVGFQSFVNICVVTGLMPNTGIPLPFVSYGLTSLLTLFAGMGFVLNVGLQPKK